MSGIINIVIGVALIGAGLSGKFVLFGTSSGTLLSVVGAAIAAMGIYQLIRSRR